MVRSEIQIIIASSCLSVQAHAGTRGRLQLLALPDLARFQVYGQLFGQEIQQVNMKIEFLGKLFEQVPAWRMAEVMSISFRYGAEISLPSSVLIRAAS